MGAVSLKRGGYQSSWLGVDYVEFKDTANPSLVHIFYADAEGFAELVDKWKAGARWYSEETGAFLRSAAGGTELVNRSASSSGTRTLAAWKTPAEPKGKRGWINLDGAETPTIGRDRTSIVIRMSLPVRSELLRLAEQSDEDGDETGGFLFGSPSYSAGGRVIQITSAVRAAKDRERTSFAYDYPVLRSHLNAAGNGPLRLIGDFHTHPETGSATGASCNDRVCWLQHLDLFRANEDPRLTEWLGLILAYDPRSTSLFPTRCMHSWVTRRDSADGPLTEKVGFQW